MTSVRSRRVLSADGDRPAVPVTEQKILFARSGNLCAFPGCKQNLVEPATGEDSAVLLGHVAHIVGASRQGPRGSTPLTAEERSSHMNLILLCRDHHGIIDAQPRTYSIAVLRQMKADHEARVAASLSHGQASTVTLESETLYSSLLPVTHLPARVFTAPVWCDESAYEEVKRSQVRYPRSNDVLVPFLLRDGRVFTFFDLRRQSHPFQALTTGPVEEISAEVWWRDPEGARRYQTLLNRMLHKLLSRRGVRYDHEHKRYFFEPAEQGKVRDLRYRLQTGGRSSRNVVWQPVTRVTGEPKSYWIHLAAGLAFQQVASRQWCLAVRPERRLTKDGVVPIDSKRVGRRVTRLKARMYNDKYLGELYFWLSVLAGDRPRFTVNLGGQSVVVDARLLAFDIRWPGVPDDSPERRVEPAEDDLFSMAELDEALHGDDHEGLDEGDGDEEDFS